jgi:hypothetical protein
MRKLITALFVGITAALGFVVTAAVADYTVRDSEGITRTIFAFVCQSTKICPAHVLIKSDGVEIGTTSNPIATQRILSGTFGGVAPNGTTTAASNAIFKSSAGNLYYINVTIGATTGWAMVFDANAMPSNGATGSSLKWCYPVLSDTTRGGVTERFDPPLQFVTGVVVAFSSTGCNTLTASSTAFFYAQVQ